MIQGSLQRFALVSRIFVYWPWNPRRLEPGGEMGGWSEKLPLMLLNGAVIDTPRALAAAASKNRVDGVIES